MEKWKENKVVGFFLPEPVNSSDFMRFGIVVSPSGCRKTYAIKQFCNEYPSGMLYHKVKGPSAFVSGLSEEIGMKTSPRTVLDLLLGYISQKYTHYYELPDDQIDGITMVLDVLWKGASRYAIEQQNIPVLVVDGVDLLAKHEKELCCRLITLAKVLGMTMNLKLC